MLSETTISALEQLSHIPIIRSLYNKLISLPKSQDKKTIIESQKAIQFTHHTVIANPEIYNQITGLKEKLRNIFIQEINNYYSDKFDIISLEKINELDSDRIFVAENGIVYDFLWLSKHIRQNKKFINYYREEFSTADIEILRAMDLYHKEKLPTRRELLAQRINDTPFLSKNLGAFLNIFFEDDPEDYDRLLNILADNFETISIFTEILNILNDSKISINRELILFLIKNINYAEHILSFIKNIDGLEVSCSRIIYKNLYIYLEKLHEITIIKNILEKNFVLPESKLSFIFLLKNIENIIDYARILTLCNKYAGVINGIFCSYLNEIKSCPGRFYDIISLLNSRHILSSELINNLIKATTPLEQEKFFDYVFNAFIFMTETGLLTHETATEALRYIFIFDNKDLISKLNSIKPSKEAPNKAYKEIKNSIDKILAKPRNTACGDMPKCSIM